MLIFPWSNLSNEAYIKLDNFKIDSKVVDIDRDLSIIPWIFNQDDRVSINRATMTKFGFKVAELTVVFVKD